VKGVESAEARRRAAAAAAERPVRVRLRPDRGFVVPAAVILGLTAAAASLLGATAFIDQLMRNRALATLAWVVAIVALAAVALLLHWRRRQARSVREVVGAERERRRVEARYAALMREAKEIVLLIDRDNRVVEANDFALTTYGYSRDDLVGRHIDTFRVPQSEVTVADRTRQLEEAGGHLTFESLHRRSDGVEFPVEVGLSIVAIEGEEYYLEIVRDIGERKAADAALRDSEERYRTVFESARSGFALHEVVLDASGEPVDFVVLAANPAFETQTGLAVADLVGRRGLDVIPGLAESGLVQRFGRVALTGEAERFEMWAPGLGRYLDQQVVSPRRGQFALIVLDITEQRSAEAELSRLSQRFEATVMASPLAMVALGGDRRVQLWNPAAAAIFGWSAEEVVGEPPPFIPADSMAQADALQERLLAGEQFSGLDLLCVRRDGARIHTSASLALIRGEEASYSVLIIIEDVTERRATVVRLARLTRLYQMLSAVTEAIPEERDPERLYDKVCRIAVEQGAFQLAWVGQRRRNGAVRVRASAGADSAAAELAAELHVPTDRPGTMGVALGEGRSDTCPDIAADPRMAPFAPAAEAHGLRSSAAVPIVIDGHHDMALAIYSSEPGRFDAEEVGLLERLAADVGFAIEAAGRERARRKAERQLGALNADLERRVRERTDELEAANTELEAFSYSVSHDLRAPLRALDGFSLALLEDFGQDLEGDAADYLRRIRAASQRMARLIDDLLMLSRMTRRGMTWERVDLSALSRSIAGELVDDDPGRQVKFTVTPKMTADGDAQLLEVALRNLLGNAWKFTSRTEGARVDVGTEVRGEERVFFVRDNGAGFDAQYADKLFAPFHRLHGDDEFPGTGIGLATVQRIVRRHGGRVWAEGATGMGATVWFTLGPRGEGE
jgi:PAS domain S-box-containing protein